MISQCPKCHDRLTDFAVSCEKCGWSIVETASQELEPSAPQPSNAGGAPQQASPHPFADDFPVIVVKHVAKTAAPPPPQEKFTEDIPPTVRNTHGMTTVTDLPPLEIDLQIQRAMDYIEQENYTSALGFLNRAIIDVPADRLAECFSLRGYVHLKNLDFPKAENDCTQAISQDWEDAQTYAWRAAARGEQDKWRKAFDDLEIACELSGAHRDQYLGLMDSYSETASEYYREEIKNGNDSADLFFERGWIYYRSGKYTKAERDFHHAISVKPDHPWASVGLAKLRFAMPRRSTSESQAILNLCNTATHGDNNCERAALEIRARLNHQTGRTSSAQRDLNRLFELAGTDLKRRVACCELSAELGDYITALDGLNEVLELQPNQHIATLVRGDCYRSIKNYSLAIADYKRFIRFHPEDVKALTRRAEMFLAVGRHNLAHVDLDDAIHVDPTNFDAYLIRSRVFLSESKLDQALTDCQKAVRLDNQQPQAFAVLGEIYQQLCDYSRAIEEYSRSIELAATTEEKAQNLYHRGVVFHQNDFFDEALKDFKKSCKLRPNHAGSWIWNAITCSRIEKWSEAIAGLQQAIAVRPSALHQYQKLGKPVAEQAVNHFDRQIQRGHDDAHSFQQRGLANQFLGNVGNASRDYTTALEKSPGNIETLIRRGQVYAQAKQHAAAVKDFTAVIRADSNNHAARYSRAISRSATGQPDEARSDIIKAIKIAPQHPRYHILLAELQLKAGDLAKVIRSYDKAILQDPSDPISYRRRGATHALDRNYVAAVSDFTHSLELYPAQIEVLAQRGHAFLKADQPNAALEDFELALTHNDKLALAYSGRASVLVMQNRHEYTLMWLTKAIHRFTEPRELAEVLYARGKVFSQMGRFSPANSDFTATIDLIRSDPKYVAKVRYSRAIANLQAEKWPKAEKDFRKLNRRNPNDTSVNQALQWLADRSKPRPESLGEHKPFRRPTRPPVTRRGVRLVETANRWESSPPYDTWVVRNAEKKEYGPVHYGILKTWIQDGRIDMGMKLLRADWSKWKRAEKIFSEISPVESQPLADDFPGIDVNGNQVNSNGDA